MEEDCEDVNGFPAPLDMFCAEIVAYQNKS